MTGAWRGIKKHEGGVGWLNHRMPKAPRLKVSGPGAGGTTGVGLAWELRWRVGGWAAVTTTMAPGPWRIIALVGRCWSGVWSSRWHSWAGSPKWQYCAPLPGPIPSDADPTSSASSVLHSSEWCLRCDYGDIGAPGQIFQNTNKNIVVIRGRDP